MLADLHDRHIALRDTRQQIRPACDFQIFDANGDERLVIGEQPHEIAWKKDTADEKRHGNHDTMADAHAE